MATAGRMSTAAPANPIAVATDAPLASDPAIRMTARADMDRIADTASAQPVIARPSPRSRNCR